MADKSPREFGKAKCSGCLKLQEEIGHLKSLLTTHGIPWELQGETKAECSPDTSSTSKNENLNLSTAEKIALFRGLFRGRTDVYPVRWESAKGKSAYSPACSNDWRSGVCGKPSIRCGDCDQRLFVPVTDQVIYDHLTGKHTVGVYPLMSDETCFFLAVDFGEADWREDAQAFTQSCREIEIPAALKFPARERVRTSGSSSPRRYLPGMPAGWVRR
jgi:hypothetical protein